jgi:hypothetical protein
MYLLQYPLRPTYRPYGDQGRLVKTECRLEEKSLRLTYELSKQKNYNADTAESCGSQQVLTSSRVRTSGYVMCCGVLHEDRMMVTPFQSICPLRPEFEHIDAKRRTDGKDEQQHAREDLGLERVQVSYQPQESARTGDKRQEPWQNLDMYDADSHEANEVYRLYFLNEIDDPKIRAYKRRELQFSTDTDRYLSSICNDSLAVSGRPEGEAIEHVDMSLARLPTDRQVEHLLRRDVVVSWGDLKPSLPPNTRLQYSDAELLGFLRQVAWVIQGNFVLKTELTKHTGLKATVRDLLLQLLIVKEQLEYDKILGTLSEKVIDGKAFLGIIQEICKPIGNGTAWTLKNPKDNSFSQEFREFATESCEALKSLTVVEKIRAAQQQEQAASALHGRLPSIVRELLMKGPMTLPEMKKSVQKDHSKEAVNDADLVQVLNAHEVGAMESRGYYFLKSRGDPVLDRYRDTLITMQRTRTDMSKEEIKAEIETIAGGTIELSDHLLRKVMREFADKNAQGNWVFKGLTPPRV